MGGFTDYLVGTYNDMIVTAFKIVSVTREEFEVRKTSSLSWMSFYNPDRSRESFPESTREVDPAAWLIGSPIPGGSWKKGEARGTRRYPLPTYLKDHPELTERGKGFQPRWRRTFSLIFEAMAGYRSKTSRP